MKTLAVLALLFVAPLLLSPASGDSDRWITELDRAHELAQESGKPLLLAFR